MWSGGNPRATFIGALIGFGLGAAVGAKVNSDNHGGAAAKAVLVFGSLGALIGAVAGQSFEPAHFRRDYRRRFPEDEESDEFRSSSRAVRR